MEYEVKYNLHGNSTAVTAPRWMGILERPQGGLGVPGGLGCLKGGVSGILVGHWGGVDQVRDNCK